MDVIITAVAEAGRQGEVRQSGALSNDLQGVGEMGWAAAQSPWQRNDPGGLLQGGTVRLWAGPALASTRSGVRGGGTFAHLKRAGERIKTDRRDACKLARLLRARELTPVYIPEATDEAMRDLCRARTDAVDDRRRARHRLKRLPTTRPFRPAGPRAIPPMRFPEPTREG